MSACARVDARTALLPGILYFCYCRNRNGPDSLWLLARHDWRGRGAFLDTHFADGGPSMKLNTTLGGAIALAAMFLIGCQTAPKTEQAKATLEQDSQTALHRMTSEDPAIQDIVDRGYAYAAFPNAGKGGL